MPAITSENTANAICKLVAADALPALLGNMTVCNLVTRDFEPEVRQPGETVNVPGATHTTPIVLSRHAEATFMIPDISKIIAVPDLLKLYMEPAVIALAERVESDLLALASQFNANAPLGQSGDQMTEALVDEAETALFEAKVPPRQPKFLVVNASAFSELRRIPKFSEYRTAGEAGLRALVEGSIGRLNDFFVFRSRFVARGQDGYRNMAFTKDAIGIAIRRLPQPMPGTGAIAEYAELGNFGMRVVMAYQHNSLAQNFSVDMLYGVGVLQAGSGVVIRS